MCIVQCTMDTEGLGGTKVLPRCNQVSLLPNQKSNIVGIHKDTRPSYCLLSFTPEVANYLLFEEYTKTINSIDLLYNV